MSRCTQIAQKDNSGEQSIVRFEGELTIETAMATKEALLKAFDSPGAIVVDLSGVDFADLSFFQLLCATHKKAVTMDREMTFVGHMDSAIQTLVDEIGYARNRCCIVGKDVQCCWHNGDR